MVIVLSAKNKLGFIDDSIEKPYNDNSHLLNFWTRNNNIVISWILNSVSKEISTSTIYSELESDICMTHKTVSNKATNDVFFKYIVSWLTWTKNNFLLVPISQNSNPYGKSWATSVLHAPVGNAFVVDSHYHMENIMSFLTGLDEFYAQIRDQLLWILFLQSTRFSLITREEIQRKVGSQ